MILFSDRKKLVDLYDQWRKENKVGDGPFSVMSFLQAVSVLDEDKVRQYLHGSLRGSQLRDYTEIPGYEDMPNLTARYNYLHDLLERFQQVQAYRCTRPEALAHKCPECPLWQELERIGAKATCCNWAAESKPDEAIRVLERLLSEEENGLCQPLSASGYTGETDCHGQCEHWPRNDGSNRQKRAGTRANALGVPRRSASRNDKEENEMHRSVNLYWEPERPTEPPKEKTYCCPVCGEENPARYFRNNLMEIVGCNHCVEELDAAAWEADHAN